MRYTNLEGMFSHYHEVRSGLQSCRTSMPDSEALSMDIQVSCTQKSRDRLLDKTTFIADIKLFINSLEWCDRYVLMGQMRPPGEKSLSWDKIIKIIRTMAEGRKLSTRYKYKSDMSNWYWDILYPHAENHFRKIGYLR